jgi:hypothetical protein
VWTIGEKTSAAFTYAGFDALKAFALEHLTEDEKWWV